jgi:hypothetical protein
MATQAPTVRTTTGSAVGSSVVVVSWIIDGVQKEKLRLLVLWRGKPGWIVTAPDRTRAAAGSSPADVTGGPITQHLDFGSVSLTLLFDARTNTVQIAGRRVALGTNNVVFVDDVDRADGPHIVKTLSLDAGDSASALQIDDLFRRSAELREFLRCDLNTGRGQSLHETVTMCDRLPGGRQWNRTGAAVIMPGSVENWRGNPSAAPWLYPGFPPSCLSVANSQLRFHDPESVLLDSA